jgi:hypothetical protein
MTKANHVVIGVFKNREKLNQAVDSLKTSGFQNSDISILMSDLSGTREFAQEKGTKAPQGATAGGTAGAALGGALGWLTGIGALAIPGVGPFIAAGPIMAALAGAGVGGLVGGISGALIGMGVPENDAKRYEGSVKSGGILLSVHSDNSEWADKSKDVLQKNGAQEVSYSDEAKFDKDPDKWQKDRSKIA